MPFVNASAAGLGGRHRLQEVAAALRHGVFLAPFGPFASPRAAAELAAAAEEAGWDGFFCWDHVLRSPPDLPVADPFVTLSAAACSTTRIRLGPMVTPLARRRPQVLVRQVVSLDHLSEGRAVLGLGLGVDGHGELSRFGEVVGEKERGDLLDEGAALLAAMMTGEEVVHHGRHFTVDGASFLPRPLQRPRVPMWFGARGLRPASRAVRRAARYDGLFLVEASSSALSRAVEVVASERGGLEGFDVAVELGDELDATAAADGGATWAMSVFPATRDRERIAAAVTAGPPR